MFEEFFFGQVLSEGKVMDYEEIEELDQENEDDFEVLEIENFLRRRRNVEDDSRRGDELAADDGKNPTALSGWPAGKPQVR